MSKETRSLLIILGLPLVLAALVLAVSTALRSPVHADGAGVDTRNGHALTTIDAGGGVTYLCVSNYTQYGTDPTPRQFLTMYEVQRNGTGKATLHLVGSRCIDFDRGFPELGFRSPEGASPIELEKALERFRTPKRRPDRASNSAPDEPRPASND